MKTHEISPHDAATSSSRVNDRIAVLASHNWNRAKSEAMAKEEGIELTDEHLQVLVFLRKYYLEHGIPGNARIISNALDKQFSAMGGIKYLRRLFIGGPVTQGSRLANLRIPAYAIDRSFGTAY